MRALGLRFAGFGLGSLWGSGVDWLGVEGLGYCLASECVSATQLLHIEPSIHMTQLIHDAVTRYRLLKPKLFGSENGDIEGGIVGIQGKQLSLDDFKLTPGKIFTLSVDDVPVPVDIAKQASMFGFDQAPSCVPQKMAIIFNSADAVTHGHMENHVHDQIFFVLGGIKWYMVWNFSTEKGFPGSLDHQINVLDLNGQRVKALIRNGFFPSIHRVAEGQALCVPAGSFHAAVTEQDSGD